VRQGARALFFGAGQGMLVMRVTHVQQTAQVLSLRGYVYYRLHNRLGFVHQASGLIVYHLNLFQPLAKQKGANNFCALMI
jgi:hypothetical protein